MHHYPWAPRRCSGGRPIGKQINDKCLIIITVPHKYLTIIFGFYQAINSSGNLLMVVNRGQRSFFDLKLVRYDRMLVICDPYFSNNFRDFLAITACFKTNSPENFLYPFIWNRWKL